LRRLPVRSGSTDHSLRGPFPSRGLSVPIEQGPGDDEPLDLLRSFVELRDLRVAHHPLDGELVDVAVPTEHLNRVGRDAHRRVPGDEFTQGRPAARVAGTGLDLRARLVQE